MKTRRIISMVAAGMALAACSQVSDVTKISGTVSLSAIDEVNILIPELQIDTLVPIKNGKFYVELPANPTVLGSISAANHGVQFIPDGTELMVVLSDESKVTSKTPARSVQTRMVEYQDSMLAIQKNFQKDVEVLSSDTSLTESERQLQIQSNYENAIKKFADYNKQVLSQNTDNVISLFAIQQVAMMVDDHEADSLISLLSPALQETKTVKAMKHDIQVRIETAEGKMFKDFTVEDSDGKKEVFSDYVGKGKYVLVDFWASWCGPCKAEIPNVKKIYEKYRKKGLDVLSVAVWDQPMASKDTAKAYGVNWKQIINAQQIPTELYGIQGIPHIILFGPDGTILKRNLRGEEIEAELSKYIK